MAVGAQFKKGKGWPCAMLSLGGVLISLTWALSPWVDKPQSLWHMASASPDLQGHLPSLRACL